MPFKSRKQAAFLESKDSPLTASQKREWESATDFKKLPERKRKGRVRAAEHLRKAKD